MTQPFSSHSPSSLPRQTAEPKEPLAWPKGQGFSFHAALKAVYRCSCKLSAIYKKQNK